MQNKDEYTPLWVKAIGIVTAMAVGSIIGLMVALQLITWLIMHGY